MLDFNPRSREGSDAASATFRQHTQDFNPRSREGSDCSTVHPSDQDNDFNPRSREGSDRNFLHCRVCVFISIHAPAKGATSFRNVSPAYARFQSTLPRRERHLSRKKRRAGTRYFNPRSREGSDQNKRSCLITYLHFNPRSREGSDGQP